MSNATNWTLRDLQKHITSGESVVVNGHEFRGVAPRIKCADGFSVSVQASQSHYCSPRENDGPHHLVEVGFPSEPIQSIMEYAEDDSDPTRTVYGYVPIELVLDALNEHGSPQSARDPEPKS